MTRVRGSDLLLHGYIILLLVGSAAYLRTIVSGDKAGRPSYTPAWYANDAALSGNFSLAADLDNCTFREDVGDEACGRSSARVHFTARVQPGTDAKHDKGLFLVVVVTHDWGSWKQANHPIAMPASLFAEDADGGLTAHAEACLGVPSFTYAFGCLSDGPPTSGKMCAEPPCYGTTGAPFGDCLALASVCAGTCRTAAVEPYFIEPSRCTADGRVPLDAVRAFHRDGTIEAPYIVFMAACIPIWGSNPRLSRLSKERAKRKRERGVKSATHAFGPGIWTDAFGLVYFLLMYLPGVGQLQARTPTWPFLLEAHRKGSVGVSHGRQRERESKSFLRNRMSAAVADSGGDGDVRGVSPEPGTIDEAAEAEDEDGEEMSALSPLLEPANREAAIHIKAYEAKLESQGGGAVKAEGSTGVTTISFSISAGEGPNIIIRNVLGKIVANLALAKEWNGAGAMQIIDGIADEGHRIGAYYLVRAMGIVFYESLFPSLALKLGERWLAAMNNDKAAKDVGVFDKKANVFEMLSHDDQARPEIRYVRYVASLFPMLNAFTVPIDALFDKALGLPFLSSVGYDAAVRVVATRLNLDPASPPPAGALKNVTSSDREAIVEDLAKVVGVTDHHACVTLLRQVLHDLQQGVKAAKTLGELVKDTEHPKSASFQFRVGGAAATDASFSGPESSPVPAGRRRGRRMSLTMVRQRVQPASKVDSTKRHLGQHGSVSTIPGLADHRAAEDSHFFSPGFVRQFGLTFLGHKPNAEMDTAAVRKSAGPGASDASTYLIALAKLPARDPLGCDAFNDIAACLSLEQSAALLRATSRRFYAYDHVETVALSDDGIRSLYIARGRPDKWQPWTKPNHRRTLQSGSWACAKPADGSAQAWWAARRSLALLNRISRDRAFGQFYADSADPSAGADEFGSRPLPTLALLNQHLGKAGGLNFGLDAILRTEGVAPPSLERPYVFGIVDARHAVDGRFWKHVLPEFYEADDVRQRIFFNPEVRLCQLPHSYIGVESAGSNDVLGLQNTFYFGGMALFRDRCYGMTSAGTGGIWTITSASECSGFFFGRTMIEDTTSSHKWFLRGYCSKYLAPLRGAPALMRAVPKVSANYLEALERWDTGAIQALVAQALCTAWFWGMMVALLAVGAALVVPAFTATLPISEILQDPFSDVHVSHAICLLFSASVFALLALGVPLLALAAPRRLNDALRYLIIFFNCTYPFTSVPSVLWLSFPPWIVATGAFPFRWNAVPAVVGSLVLKAVELLAVGRMQALGGGLDEESLARTQQMQLVTVPIKLRAIYKGLKTGWNDVVARHDNSWWESFGGSGAVTWVRIWLIAIFLSMTVTMAAGIMRLIVVGVTEELSEFTRELLPLLYGCALALINLLTIFEPLRFILKGQSAGVGLRWTEVAVQALLLFGTLLLLIGAGYTITVTV